ncbi:MAG: histidinol-phosphatase HisJ family protein [Parasporobacterium sp.]|nr:histidinol-phosphatase HisJ family protein [Parasporobacterium sp.]
MYFDCHNHTRFSADSEANPEDMLKKAIERGVTRYCFTDHQDFDFPYEDLKFDVDAKEYFDTLLPIKKKYADKIEVNIGIELGLENHLWDRLDEYAKSADFDFVIGSMHLLDRKDPYYPEFFEGKDEVDLFRRFFESTYENIKGFKNFDVLGHLDYVVRYAPTKNENYSYNKFSDIIDAILKELIESGRGIEINSSGFRRGLGEPHPCFEVVKRYKELGGEIITTGSDAHVKEDVARDFDKIYALIKEAGFNYICAFNKRKADFFKI